MACLVCTCIRVICGEEKGNRERHGRHHRQRRYLAVDLTRYFVLVLGDHPAILHSSVADVRIRVDGLSETSFWVVHSLSNPMPLIGPECVKVSVPSYQSNVLCSPSRPSVSQ